MTSLVVQLLYQIKLNIWKVIQLQKFYYTEVVLWFYCNWQNVIKKLWKKISFHKRLLEIVLLNIDANKYILRYLSKLQKRSKCDRLELNHAHSCSHAMRHVRMLWVSCISNHINATTLCILTIHYKSIKLYQIKRQSYHVKKIRC